MAVPVKQAIPITFNGGLDTKTDPKQIAPADFLELNNMVFSKGGSLVKRNGFETLGTIVSAPTQTLIFPAFDTSGTGTILDARKIFAYNDELLVNDAWNLFSYDATENKWNYKGRSTMVSVSTANVIQNSNTFTMANEAVTYDENARITAFSRLEGVNYLTYYTIQDIATGQIIVNQAAFPAGASYNKPTVISFKDPLSTDAITYVVAQNTANKNLYYVKIVNQVVQGGGVPVNFYSAIGANGFYDLHIDFLGNIILAVGNATDFITVSKLDSSLAVVSSYTSPTEKALTALTWFDTGPTIYVAYGTATEIKLLSINSSTFTLSGGPYVIDTIILGPNLNNITGVWSTVFNRAFLFWDYLTIDVNGTTTSSTTLYTNVTSGGVVGIPKGAFVLSANINSRAFTVDGIPHVVAHYSQATDITTGVGTSTRASLQPTDFLLNVYNLTSSMDVTTATDLGANIAAKISADQSSPFAPFKNTLSNPVFTDDRIVELALLKNSNYTLTGALQDPAFSPTGVITTEFDFNLSNPDVQVLGNNALISAGALLMYDGANVCEQNFHIYPNTPSFTILNAGGALGQNTGTSLYSYQLVYEWIDNQGQVHRSFPCPVTTAYATPNAYTFASGVKTGKITLQIPYLNITNKPGTQVVVNVYRTLANGAIYYLVGATYYSKSIFGSVPNSVYGIVTTFDDTYGDSVIQQNPQLYTTGALGYYAPPAPSRLSNFKSRAVMIAAEEQNTFLYSNQTLPNFPVQFVPEFVQNVNSVGGRIKALSYLDDKLIIFKDGKVPGPSILFLLGQGPAPSGANNDFVDPIPVSIDVGCVEPSSITQSPVGLIFKSNKGIFLLDRSLQTSYIGFSVEKYNDQKVISGQLIPNTTQVRFILENGTMLMFDYFYKRWATFSTPAAVSDCIWQGEHCFVTSAGEVYKEKPNYFADGTNPINMSFKTAWIKLSNLQNYQRAYFYYLLGECQSSTQLELSTYFDYSDYPLQTNTITPVVGELLTWRVFLANQRCQAFAISLQEINGTIGEGFNLSGLNLIAGLKNTFIPQPNAYTVG